MNLDPATLTEQGVKDGIAAFRELDGVLKVRLREAEGRLAGAEQDVTQLRKLVTFVRGLSDAYRTQLAVIQSGPIRSPDG